MGAGELPTHSGHATSTTSAEPPDALLCAILAPLVGPTSDARLDAAGLAKGHAAARERDRFSSSPLLDGGRLRPLLAWVSLRPGRASTSGRPQPPWRSWTGGAQRASGTSPPSPGSCSRPCWLFGPWPPGCIPKPGPSLSRTWSVNPIRPGRTGASADRADSPFLSPASLLLRQAGYELEG